MRRRGVKLWGNYKLCVGAAALPRPSDMRRLSFGRGRTPPLRITWSAVRVERATARVAPTQGLGCGGQRRGVGEIGEAPPVAEEASRFRGSAPIGGHDSGRESVGATVGNRRPLRGHNKWCGSYRRRGEGTPPCGGYSARRWTPHFHKNVIPRSAATWESVFLIRQEARRVGRYGSPNR